MTIRTPAVAGSFYPADHEQLRNMIKGFLNQIEIVEDILPKAIIVPHAGYIYSGAIAACAYARLLTARTTICKVVLLGPSHRLPFTGLAASSASHFATPLGTIPLDTATIKKLSSLPQVIMLDKAHTYEHSLEVQLPFLQEIFEDFSLIPLLTGDINPQQVAEVLETVWGGDETIVVISSDLSHYHDYKTARQLDQLTSKAIENLRFEEIRPEHACGCNSIKGLLYFAKQHHLHAKTIDLRNSGDTAGPRHQVVGYGAYTVH